MARKRSKSIGRKRARRRRYIRLQSQAFVFPRRIAVSLALIFGVAMAYITLANTNKSLGHQIKKLEAKKDTTRNKALNELFRWQNMTSLEKMDATLARYGLNMKFPESSSSPTRHPVHETLYAIRVAGNQGHGKQQEQRVENNRPHVEHEQDHQGKHHRDSNEAAKYPRVKNRDDKAEFPGHGEPIHELPEPLLVDLDEEGGKIILTTLDVIKGEQLAAHGHAVQVEPAA